MSVQIFPVMLIDRDFPDHWKTQLLMRLLGNYEAAPVLLIRLWGHCEARRTGTFTELSAEALAAICRYGGDAEKLDRALQETRFIVRNGKGVEVHEWEDRNRGLLTAISNGKKGGRPRKNPRATGGEPTENPRVSDGKPVGNPQATGGEPTGNPDETNYIILEESRGEIPPTVPQGGTCESSNSTPQPPPSRDFSEKKSGAGDSAAMLEETRRFICSLVGRQRGLLGVTAEHTLAELAQKNALPLSDADKDLLRRFYAAPADDSDPMLRRRRWDADSIACNLLTELDRAGVWDRGQGGQPPIAKKSAPAEPSGWREKFAKKFPRAAMPASWADLDERIQRELLGTDEQEDAA